MSNIIRIYINAKHIKKALEEDQTHVAKFFSWTINNLKNAEVINLKTLKNSLIAKPKKRFSYRYWMQRP